MFLDDQFLLKNDWAREMFQKYAKNEPIIDYHCHLEPQVILENKRYDNLTQIWLNDNGAGDHYKWRLMRANGVREELISGSGNDYEKFYAFVQTIEKAIGNPIFEWSHLELQRYFGIDLLICEENAEEIWTSANQKLQTDAYRPRELLEMMQVKVVCTTDDPTDDLTAHKELSKEKLSFRVLPTFRPDNVWLIHEKNYSNYIDKLSEVSGKSICTYKELKEALAQRVDFFHEVGGRLADQGLNTFYFKELSETELELIFKKAYQQEQVTEQETAAFTTAIQLYLMKLYDAHGWTMQMHMNALRNDSLVLKETIGTNVGGDSMGDQPSLAAQVVRLLAKAEKEQMLPKTILYSLNPSDWLPLATAMQSFQGGIKQKLQLGCAWWFNDTYEGMREQLTITAQQSLLANFTGMLTDSRSFLSYPRHEYFRRVLCQLLSEWVEAGRIPAEESYIGRIIRDICYNNAEEYFGFLPKEVEVASHG